MLVFLIAGWAIITGIFEIVEAIRLRKEIKDEWLLVLNGILSVTLGVLLVIWPRASLVVLVWLTGIYAILFGLLMILLGFRLRGFDQRLERLAE